VTIGADLCSTVGDDERDRLLTVRMEVGRPFPQWGSGGNTPENFGKCICQTVHFGEYLCDNWSTEWVHFDLLNTDVEAFLNQMSY